MRPEAEFMAQVTELAELYGWQWVHFRPGQTAKGWRTAVSGPLGRGWPDLYMARTRDQRQLFVELKVEADVTVHQHAVLAILQDAGASVYIWRPGDWDVITAVLR